MLCQKCQKNNATVKIIKNYNGNITEQYLCQSCAGNDEIHISDITNNTIFNELFGMFKPVISSDYVCDKCHTTYNEFKKTGKFGCEKCFLKFEPYLDSLFRNIHSSDTHKGKLPKKCADEIIRKREKEDLKESLKKAIYEENYEEAARLRDIIRKMEG